MKQLSDCRVLLVDDARVNLDILVEGLKDDHKLSLALDGEKALQIAARTPIDLVLLDIMMPGLDGYEVCRRLRQMPETAEVPIMFLSSLEEVQDKTRGFEVGANDYLTKPFDMLEVKARVRSLLKAKAYSDAVKEQIAGELRVAAEIQMGMLPQDFTDVEQRYGVQIGAVLTPAREVGGDLYGVCAASSERLVVFLGDVSGKGIPASMFMVRAISLARLLARDIAEPERILARLNDELSSDNPSGMFVTFMCAVYDPRSRQLIMANAGQCRPVLLRADAAPAWCVESLGTALGFEPGIEFQRTELTLNPGDSVVFYTDGVTEAFNTAEDCYGDDQLLADVSKLAGQSPSSVTEKLLEKVHVHSDGAPQSDDIAILTLGVADVGVSGADAGMNLELQATPQEVMRAVDDLRQYGEEQGVLAEELFGLTLALEECGSNIVNHAFRRDANASFRVALQHTDGKMIVELRDSGPPFDPTRAPERDSTTAEDDDETPGGWGIQLARRNTDEMSYTRENGENVLRFDKRLAGRSVKDQRF